MKSSFLLFSMRLIHRAEKNGDKFLLGCATQMLRTCRTGKELISNEAHSDNNRKKKNLLKHRLKFPLRKA